MSEELKPCPFCGTDNPKAHYIRDGQSLDCRECGASVHSYNPNPLEQNIEKWNRRAPIDVLSDNINFITANDESAGTA